MLLVLVWQLSCSQVAGDLLDAASRADPASQRTSSGLSTNDSSAHLLPPSSLVPAPHSHLNLVPRAYTPVWPMVLAAGAVMSLGTTVGGLTVATGWAGWGLSMAANRVLIATTVLMGASLLVLIAVITVTAILNHVRSHQPVRTPDPMLRLTRDERREDRRESGTALGPSRTLLPTGGLVLGF